jgi:hypothetical protein
VNIWYKISLWYLIVYSDQGISPLKYSFMSRFKTNGKCLIFLLRPGTSHNHLSSVSLRRAERLTGEEMLLTFAYTERRTT